MIVFLNEDDILELAFKIIKDAKNITTTPYRR